MCQLVFKYACISCFISERHYVFIIYYYIFLFTLHYVSLVIIFVSFTGSFALSENHLPVFISAYFSIVV